MSRKPHAPAPASGFDPAGPPLPRRLALAPTLPTGPAAPGRQSRAVGAHPALLAQPLPGSTSGPWRSLAPPHRPGGTRRCMAPAWCSNRSPATPAAMWSASTVAKASSMDKACSEPCPKPRPLATLLMALRRKRADRHALGEVFEADAAHGAELLSPAPHAPSPAASSVGSTMPFSMAVCMRPVMSG